MKWFVSKEIDSDEDFQERRAFYSKLTGCRIVACGEHPSWYEMSDGRGDNRCMIVGHTNTAYEVITMLRSTQRRKFKFYLGVCTMSLDTLRRDVLRIDPESVVFIATQENIKIEGKKHLACEFLPVNETGLGFKAMRSELNMLNSTYKGFHTRLDKSFTKL